MSDTEDEYADLPYISFNSSSQDISVLSMPSASELAAQRACEEETERQLLLLRAQYESSVLDIRHTHSESSGSQGEVSAAMAVRMALQVDAGGGGGEPGVGGTGAAPDAQELLTPLVPRLDQDGFLADFLHAIKHADPDAASQLAEEVSGSIASEVMGGCSSWILADVVCVGAWLCCASVWRTPHVPRRGVLRSLHALAMSVDSGALVELAAALRALPLHTRLHMSDAARTGAGSGSRQVALADLLLSAMLTDLCTLEEEGESESADAGALVSRSWARLDGSARYLVVCVAGRMLAAARASSEERKRLLAAFAQPNMNAPSTDSRNPDQIKVVNMALSKLQLLFQAKKKFSIYDEL